MSKKMTQKYTELIKKIEDNIESEKDLEYIKKIFSDLFIDFVEEVEEITNSNIEKLSELEERQIKVEKNVDRINKDIYTNENYDFEIVCPYCNCEFETEISELKEEIACPECNNTIELDWNEETENHCGSGCAGCNGNHMHNKEEIDEDM